MKMIPEGWCEGRVEDLLQSLESGVSVNGDDRPKLPEEKAVLKVSAVSYGYFDKTACKVINGSEFERAKTNPKAGQIVISRSNTEVFVGASAYIDRDYHDLFLPDKLWQTVSKPESNMKWLSYVLASDHARYTLSKLATGTSGSMKNITKGELLTLKIEIPPFEEQKKIAKILSTWDRAIEVTEKLLKNSQQQKKSLMQQLLTGKKRLPGFSGEWDTKTLGELGEIKSAGVDKKIVDGEVPVRLLNFTDVFKRNFIYSDELNHWVTAPELKIVGCNIEVGDVFFTPSSETRDEAAFSAVAAEDIKQCCYSYHIVRFRISDHWDLNYKAYAFSTDEFRRQAFQLADGSGQRYVISQGNFRKMRVKFPEYDEQVAIGKVLKTTEEKIKNIQQKLDCLQQEKKALMQQLLTGKRRVVL